MLNASQNLTILGEGFLSNRKSNVFGVPDKAEGPRLRDMR